MLGPLLVRVDCKKKKFFDYIFYVCIATAIVTVIWYSVLLGEKYWFYYQFAPLKHAAAKILLIWNFGIGESETIERLKIAAQHLNPPIDIKVISTNRKFKFNQLQPIKTATKFFKPDFLLVLHGAEYRAGIPNYRTLTDGQEMFIKFDAQGKPVFIENGLSQFDALLPSFEDISQLKLAYEQSGRKLISMPWFVSSYITDYTPADPQNLFYSGGLIWDSTRGSDKYLQLFRLLDATGYFKVCGFKDKWKHTPNSMVGFIPVDGKSLINAMHKAGVSLVLHAKTHLDSGAPTSRIFEAAAANVVIISDKHPFVQKHFGDNVLYIDIEQDAEGMFKQINEHMNWILSHKQEAQRMAANCNAINNQNFSLEQQLLRLLDMHAQNIVNSGALTRN